MKIIGKTEHDEYVVVVHHSEIEKAVDKYYGKLDRLKVGQEFNLGAGYDFRSEIRHAFDGMERAMKQFESAKATLTRFAELVRQLPEPPVDSTEVKP